MYRDRVLVVDDAPSLRELLSVLLEVEDDFEVVGTASDGARALELADALEPDVVLLDLAMPGMDGMKALPELRARLPLARIVIFSAYEVDALGAEARAAGADDFVEKGASVLSLVDRLRALRPPDWGTAQRRAAGPGRGGTMGHDGAMGHDGTMGA